MKTDEQFCQFVHEARHDEAIRLVNDDVTLMLISVDDNQGTKEAKLGSTIADTNPRTN